MKYTFQAMTAKIKSAVNETTSKIFKFSGNGFFNDSGKNSNNKSIKKSNLNGSRDDKQNGNKAKYANATNAKVIKSTGNNKTKPKASANNKSKSSVKSRKETKNTVLKGSSKKTDNRTMPKKTSDTKTKKSSITSKMNSSKPKSEQGKKLSTRTSPKKKAPPNIERKKIKRTPAAEYRKVTKNFGEYRKAHFNELYAEVIKYDLFPDPIVPLKLINGAIINCKLYSNNIVRATSQTLEKIEKEKLSDDQVLFILNWLVSFLERTQLGDGISLKDFANVFEGHAFLYAKKLSKSRNIRKSLAGVLQKEINRLPKTLQEVSPEKRLSLLPKLLPYIEDEINSYDSSSLLYANNHLKSLDND